MIQQALDLGMGVGMDCECKYGQTITLEDLHKAILISQKEYKSLSL